jgi:4-hydroxybenzoate polyprenyltransferase
VTARETFRAWASFLRLPNLFTVPGDPLAGFAVATAGAVAAGSTAHALIAAASSCCLYLGGLALNDLLDVEIDRRERPDRPLPSGRISIPAAIAAIFGLFLVGLAVVYPLGPKPLAAAAGVALLVILYNSPLRRVPALGPVLMGSCRAASFFLGVTIGYVKGHSNTDGILVGFETILVYIAAVTLLSRLETTGRNPRLSAGLPPAALWVGLICLAWVMPPTGVNWAGFGLASLAAGALAFDASRCMWRQGKVLPPMIGQLISVLVFWQTAQLFAAGRPLWALVILTGWPASRWLGRRFHQS